MIRRDYCQAMASLGFIILSFVRENVVIFNILMFNLELEGGWYGLVLPDIGIKGC